MRMFPRWRRSFWQCLETSEGSAVVRRHYALGPSLARQGNFTEPRAKCATYAVSAPSTHEKSPRSFQPVPGGEFNGQVAMYARERA